MKGVYRILMLIVYRIVASFPLCVRIWIGKYGGMMLTPLFKRENKFLKLQTKLFLGREISPFKIYAQLGQSYFEAMRIGDIKDENVKVYGLSEEDKKRLYSKRPTLVLTAHLGNWELLASYFIKSGLNIAVAAKMSRIAIGQELIKSVRDKYGIKTIWRGGMTGTREILEQFKNNSLMAVLIDQHTHVSSLHSQFFGHEVLVPDSLIKFAKKHNTDILMAFNIREDTYHYSCHLKYIDNTKTEEEIVQEYNDTLEQLIRKYPDQWVWFHKRWRTLNGKELSRKNYEAHLLDLLSKKEKDF